MNTVTAIKNTENYALRMEGSMAEKLFFLNQIPTGAVDTIVDFGCADGCLFQAMRQLGIDWQQIGIDNEVAFKELFLLRNPNATWIRSQYPALDNVADPKHCILNLSSVIHEVYSYMDPKQVELFWKSVFESGFQYIVVRDMITVDGKNTAANIFDLVKLNNNETYRAQKDDYERVYGKITTSYHLYHFLLKYRYVENWNRELHENYLPLTLDGLMDIISNGNYEIVFKNLYTNQFINNQVENDFGIQMQNPTHVQLMLKRKSEEL